MTDLPRRVRVLTNNARPIFWRIYDADTGRELHNVRSIVIRAGVDQPTMAELTLLKIPYEIEPESKTVKTEMVTVPAEFEVNIVAPTREPAT